MSALHVINPGARSLMQDLGFAGARGIGVPRGGALDRDTLVLLNGLLGNEPGTAALEIAVTSPRLRAEDGPVRVACGRGLTGRITRGGEALAQLHEWCAATLSPGDELALDAPARGGTALLGIGGGLDLPQVFGSRSTLVSAGFGGVEGRALTAGDRLQTGAYDGLESPLRLREAPPAPARIRVVPGPQAEWFTDAAMDSFLRQPWRVSPALDRMGMRLEGDALAHDPERGADIVSDGVVPGAIQVPGEGLPIVLLADAQTTGGYPKIATIITADLSAAARAVPGDTLHFVRVTVDEAEAAGREHRAALAHMAGDHAPAVTSPEGMLYAANLISGAVDGPAPDHFPGHLSEKETP